MTDIDKQVQDLIDAMVAKDMEALDRAIDAVRVYGYSWVTFFDSNDGRKIGDYVECGNEVWIGANRRGDPIIAEPGDTWPFDISDDAHWGEAMRVLTAPHSRLTRIAKAIRDQYGSQS